MGLRGRGRRPRQGGGEQRSENSKPAGGEGGSQLGIEFLRYNSLGADRHHGPIPVRTNTSNVGYKGGWAIGSSTRLFNSVNLIAVSAGIG